MVVLTTCQQLEVVRGTGLVRLCCWLRLRLGVSLCGWLVVVVSMSSLASGCSRYRHFDGKLKLLYGLHLSASIGGPTGD